MSQLGKIVVRNLARFQMELASFDQTRIKAAQTAVRVEGYRLKKVLAAEIKAGAPGGRKFSPLSDIARKKGRGGEGRAPLRRLAIPVRYWVENGAGRFSVLVGYQDKNVVNSRGQILGAKVQEDGSRQATSQSRLSASWLNIVKNTVEGRSFRAGQFKKEGIYSQGWNARTAIVAAAFGGRKGKKSLKPGRERFLLRRSTSTLRIPARPIIEPFWAAHQAEAGRNILVNFERKLNGERI